MSAIFISHSSHDNDAVAELKERLLTWGYGSVFLDFDPEAGIPAGRDWEQELYHQLRTCRAVLVLCSPHSMTSHWCFAEITHAKSLGKHVLPLKIADCEVHPVLAERQVLDLAREGAHEQLEQALQEILGEGFPWDRERPPYPGLLAFQEPDAAVFFGRGPEIHAGLDSLARLRRFGAGRALMVLGASGSGKSSLVRAGLIPRLRRDERRWLIARPFRPLDRPWRELAVALAGTFADLGRERDWRRLAQDLERAAAASVPSPEALIAAARDLRLAGGRKEARVLLTLDQAEELLGCEGEAQARFAPLLQAALAAPQSPLMVVATLRTDLLAEFQQHPATRHLEFDDLRIGPMTAEGLAEVVAGPARLADVDLSDGLTDALVGDAQAENALPLLAFALRELYERYGEDRRLTLEEYRHDLGGLGGSVAQAAESVLAAKPRTRREEELLRDAMLAMVRIDDEGRYARRVVRRADLPEEVHPLIDGFVAARLLVARGAGGERRVEVAHEALFRSWDRLRRWLDENRELLLWRKRLDTGRREWERTGRHPSLLLAGPALDEGRRWLAKRGGQLSAAEKAFLGASIGAAAARRRRKVAAAALAGAALVLVAVGGLWLWRRAEEQRARAEDGTLVAVAGELMDTDPTRAAQVLLEVEDPERTAFAVVRMRQALDHRLASRELTGHRERVTAVAFSPDGARLLTGSWDQTARLASRDGEGVDVELPHDELVTAVAFGPGGERLLTVTEGGTVRVWPADGEAPPRVFENPTAGVTAAFGPGGRRLLSVARNGTARVWRLDAEADPVVLGGADHFVLRAAFAPGGDRVVTVARDGSAASWRSDRAAEPRAVASTGGAVRLAELSPLGNRLLAVGEDGAAAVWDLDEPGARRELAGLDGAIRLARFSPLGDRLLTVTGETAWIWDLADAGPPRPVDGTSGVIEDAGFGPRGERLWLVAESGGAWLGAAKGAAEALEGHAGAVLGAAFSPHGERLATAADDGGTRIWSVERPRAATVLRGHSGPLTAASFSPSGDRVLTASYDGTARIWPAAGEARQPVVLEHGEKLLLAVFDPAGERALTISEEGIARLWPAEVGADPRVVAEDEVETAAFGPRGERLATVTWSGGLKLWPAGAADVAGEAQELGVHEGTGAVVFDPGGGRLVSASRDGTARVWDLGGSGYVELLGHDDVVRRAAFSPDGRRVVTASYDTTARVWNADGSGEAIVFRGHTHEVVTVGFSPDSRRVVTGDNGGEVRIWDLEDPDDPLVLGRHRERVTRASFSPDGRQVVSAGGGGEARLWRADGSARPLILAGHADANGEPSRLTAAVFSPDGTRVLTAAEDGTARLWLISAGALQQTIARVVSPCLPPQARRDLLGEAREEAERAHRACRQRVR